MHSAGIGFEECLQRRREPSWHVDCSMPRKEGVMLNWAITLFIIAIIAAILGFGGIAGSAAALAKIFFFVFLVLAIASFAFGRRSI
jgi:uncharacterized membrane protein YtjA (UPF0391 family)